ncbi:MAG: hypothetical protein IPP08_00705 [Chlorobiota bacterium]|nr:hypothetical protein [Chlorobiota bacterium]QQS66731.1 MAG: hypothetical protein IPP08_00705 [Chlorobiota bacterium]
MNYNFSFCQCSLFSQSFESKDFVFTFPINSENGIKGTGTLNTKVYVYSKFKSKIEIFSGNYLVIEKYTIPFDFLTIDIPTDFAQVIPYPSINNPKIPEDKLYINKSLQIISDNLITVYALSGHYFTSVGMTNYPVNSLGTHYKIQSFENASNPIFKTNGQFSISSP